MTEFTVRPLSIVLEGDEFLVGDPERMQYVLLPEVGVRVIRLLQAGHTASSAAAAIGADVDVPDFIDTLLGLGFISIGSTGAGPVASPSRGRRWVKPHHLRPLFSRAAWGLYAGCAVLAAAIFVTHPRLLPTAQSIFFLPSPLHSVVCATLFSYLLGYLHELCHWAAARAEGLDARITVSRRLYFLVFEADLSQLWGIPRNRRYGPLLAGMAFDAVLLCAVLVPRLGALAGWWHLLQGADRLLAALSLLQISALAAQFFVFVRTDLYTVLITATGCVNLWRVNQLRLLGKLRRLLPEQQRELDTAHTKDLEVARWYAFVYAAGMLLAAIFFIVYFLPALVRLVQWLVGTIAAARVNTASFWEALIFAAVVISPYAITGALVARDLVQRQGRPAVAGPSPR